MIGAGAIMLAATLLGPRALGSDPPAPPRVLDPGVYVVSSCGILGHGATEAEARRAFQQGVRAARRGWRGMPKRCAIVQLADVVRIAPGQQPVFFIAGSTLVKGTAPPDAIHRCHVQHEADKKREPGVDFGDGHDCDRVRAAYGPFRRKPAWDEFDDAGQYVFLDNEGSWIDGTGGQICFPAGTPIATPDGDRPIEALAAGSPVLSWSAERGVPVTARVVDVKRRRAHELLELGLADGRVLRVSANHPLFVPARGDWVAAGDLRAGDQLAVLTEARLQPVAVARIANRAVDVDVFDLTIETTHAYFAGGVLAHNY
jgi:hypothetical protein